MPLASSPPHDRRGFLATAALTTAVASLGAFTSTPASAAPAAPAATTTSASSFDVKDFGARGDGITDDTQAFQAAIFAAQRVLGVVVIPSGYYVIDSLTIPTLVKIMGEGADSSRFTPTARGGVNLLHLESSRDPLLIIDGGAVSIEYVALHGNGSTAPLLRVDNGFESRINRVRLFDVAGTAILVNRVNNNTWTDLFIDNCGSASEAAVVVCSPNDPTKQSNTFTCYNLTIERPGNVALDVGWRGHERNLVEFVRLPFLHIESPADEFSPARGNTDPLIRIGKVRDFELTNAFVYGGPGPLIVHDQDRAISAPLIGGIRLIGGTYLGADAKKTGAASEHLIVLENGDDFAAIGARFARYASAPISVGASYGARVAIDPTTSTDSTSVVLDDTRATPNRPTWIWPGRARFEGDFTIQGHLLSDRSASAPAATLLPGAGMNAPRPTLNGTDFAGFIHFGTGLGTAKGGLVRVTFAAPFGVTPAVQITPTGSGAATRPFFISPTKTYFDIGLAEIPPQNVTQTGFGFTYQVIG